MDPQDEVVSKDAQILVLPLERNREQLTAYHEAKQATWRPHITQLMRELLAKPLPDFPITYPVSWGIPAPFPETPGQVFNAWAEGMPASMYCTAVAQREHGEHPATTDELWLAEHDVRLVYFLGFDNAYFWGVTHLALLMAHDGRYVVPDVIVPNEFYELENEKFSTSNGHMVWTKDLLGEVPRDLVRFYLALTAPEHSRTNFSRPALEKITSARLVQPWNALAVLLDKAAAEIGAEGRQFPVSAAARDRCTALTERFTACYELTGFSLNRAADLIALHAGRLLAVASSTDFSAGVEGERALGDLYAEACLLLAAASPILIDLAEAAEHAGADLSGFRAAPRTVRAFAMPPLGSERKQRG
jgi:methionyl-tRNA synthetase